MLYHRVFNVDFLMLNRLSCAALPLVNSAGTSITCTTQADLNARIAATGATANGTTTTGSPSNGTTTGSPSNAAKGNPSNVTTGSVTTSASPAPKSTATSGSGSSSNSSSSAQTSLTLLSSVVAPNFAQNGLNTNTSEKGEVASLTTTNNFINYCATLPNLPITNGQQIKTGSCNPAPMGAIPSTSNMPSAKFVSPNNLAVVPAKTTFQVTLAIKGISTGFFVNPDTNYFAAPQQLDATSGQIQGHSHIVIEALDSLTQTTPTDPTKFAFFVGLNSKADAQGQLYANVTGGLPEGAYKMSTIITAMNHQPVLVAVAQHGAMDDQIYVSSALYVVSSCLTILLVHCRRRRKEWHNHHEYLHRWPEAFCIGLELQQFLHPCSLPHRRIMLNWLESVDPPPPFTFVVRDHIIRITQCSSIIPHSVFNCFLRLLAYIK
jgi:hypothetical protein